MKIAYAEIGKGLRTVRGEQGIDICRRTQEALVTTAALHDRVCSGKTLEFKEGISASPPSALLLLRHFDATPLYLKYGLIASEIQREGRYFVPEEYVDQYGVRLVRWKPGNHQTYQQTFPRCRCLLVSWRFLLSRFQWSQHALVVVFPNDSLPANKVFQEYREDFRHLITPPRIVARGTSGCTFTAVSAADSAWDLQTMKDLYIYIYIYRYVHLLIYRFIYISMYLPYK